MTSNAAAMPLNILSSLRPLRAKALRPGHLASIVRSRETLDPLDAI
jgi:hypothetical protein